MPSVRSYLSSWAVWNYIDLNLGCPQETAREGHFGAYLLGQKDWPLIEQMSTLVPL
jgi:tRNA-dihydrouridine synthase